METTDAYLVRKYRELSLLNSCLAARLDLAKPVSPAMAIEQKFRLAAAIKAERLLQNWSHTETARSSTEHASLGAFEFRYGYQRADLHVHGPAIYGALCAEQANIIQQTIYAGSGMSAMAAVLTALLRLKEFAEVLVPQGVYNETSELVDSFGGRLRRLSLETAHDLRRSTSGTTRVVLLDSSVRAGFFDFLRMPPRNVDLVIFDTTCFWRGSRRIRRAVNWALGSKLPLALVRSHTKLDCLGIEYGRLGSVVVATSLLGILSGELEWAADLARQTSESIRLFGTAPIPANFPPFAGTRQFDRCSVARTAAIIRNNRRLARLLSVALGTRTVSEFQHGLYLTLAPNADISVQAAKNLAGALSDELASFAYPVAHAGSFGFDFVAIEWFADPFSRRNVIRIAASDLPLSQIDRIAEGIARWWSRHEPAMTNCVRLRVHCSSPL